MSNQIPDYTNLNASLSSMTRFFYDQGVNLTASEKEQIKNVFDAANVEKEKDKNVEEQLVGKERATFMDKLKEASPTLYKKAVEFFTTVEFIEDTNNAQKETLEALENIKKNEKLENANPKDNFELQ